MKIKFSHLADIHIGNYPGKLEKGGVNSRFLDFVQTYHESVDRMIADDMDLCLMPGDIFRNKTPSPDELDAFVDGLIKLRLAKIPVVITMGNHDLFLSDRKATSISAIGKMFDYVKKAIPSELEDGFVLSIKPELVTITTKSGKVQIQTMPYPIKSVLRVATNQEVENYVIAKTDEIYETRDKSLPIIYAGHFTLRDASIGGEQFNFDKFSEPVIPKAIFKNKDYAYVAMGHLHKYQVVMENPLVVYCGSNNRVDFNEAGEDKGFVEVKITDEGTTHKFIKVNARKFCDFKYDLSDNNEPQADVMKDLATKTEEMKDAVVRITVTLSNANRDKYNVEKVIKFINEYCHYIHGSSIPIIQRPLDSKELSGFKESMSVFETLKHYAEVKKVGNKDTFLRLGEAVIKKVRGENNGM